MFAEGYHRAGLRTLRTFGKLCDETHLVADREVVEPALRHAVAMEMDLAAVGAQDEPVIGQSRWIRP